MSGCERAVLGALAGGGLVTTVDIAERTGLGWRAVPALCALLEAGLAEPPVYFLPGTPQRWRLTGAGAAALAELGATGGARWP